MFFFFSFGIQTHDSWNGSVVFLWIKNWKRGPKIKTWFSLFLCSRKQKFSLHLLMTISFDNGFSYPPPREKCAGPSCSNPYKYRDSKSKLPLCSLQCYKAVQGTMAAETICWCCQPCIIYLCLFIKHHWGLYISFLFFGSVFFFLCNRSRELALRIVHLHNFGGTKAYITMTSYWVRTWKIYIYVDLWRTLSSLGTPTWS